MRAGLVGRILAAQALSSLGSSVSSIALSYMVLKLTGSVLQMGGVLAVSTFPLVVTSFIGGAILDRFSARNVMVLADVCRAFLIFAMPFLAARSTGYIYLVAALLGVFTAMFNPGQMKLISELVDREALVKANSYLSVSQNGAELLGYLIGAPLVLALGYVLTFSIDAASYGLSALLLVGLPKPAARETEPPRLGVLIARAPQTLGMIWRRPLLRTNLLLATFAATAIMMSVPNAYGLAFDIFDRGAWGLTTLEVFMASGMILGGILLSRLSLSGDKNAYVSLSLVAMGVCFIGVSFSPLFWVSITLIGLAGVANIGTFVPSITLFQESTEGEYKGRMIAIRGGFGQVGTTAGLLVGGALGSLVGIKEAFLVAGLLGIGLTLLIYLPQRVKAEQRGRAAWSEALAAGAGRRHARAAAEAARREGVILGRTVGPVAGAAGAELSVDASAGEKEM